MTKEGIDFDSLRRALGVFFLSPPRRGRGQKKKKMADAHGDPAAGGTPTKKLVLADMSKEDLVKQLSKLMQKIRKLEDGKETSRNQVHHSPFSEYHHKHSIFPLQT